MRIWEWNKEEGFSGKMGLLGAPRQRREEESLWGRWG